MGCGTSAEVKETPVIDGVISRYIQHNPDTRSIYLRKSRGCYLVADKKIRDMGAKEIASVLMQNTVINEVGLCTLFNDLLFRE